MHLANGDAALAAKSIRDALEHPLNVPSKELPPHTELRRVPFLEAQVEIEVAAGDLELARAAADQCSAIAVRFESKALIAGAALAHGRVELAEGDTVDALHDFQEAVHLWNEVGAPYETALARLGLAQAHRVEGNEERAVLEFQAARSGFERIGAVHQVAEAAQACGNTGQPEVREREWRPQAHSSAIAPVSYDNVFHHEGDYWSVAFDGQIVRLRDLKGLRYLARLLGQPGREFHVPDLVAGDSNDEIKDGVELERTGHE